MTATNASTTTANSSPLYVDLRRQTIATLQCLRIQNELKSLPKRVGRSEIQTKCKELTAAVAELSTKWFTTIQDDDVKRQIKLISTQFDQDETRGGYCNAVIEKLARQSAAHHPIGILNPDVCATLQTPKPPSIPVWFQTMVCLDQTLKLEAKIDQFRSGLIEFVTWQTGQQEQAAGVASKVASEVTRKQSELDKAIKRTRSELSTTPDFMQRWFDPTSIQWAVYCDDLLVRIQNAMREIDSLRNTDAISPPPSVGTRRSAGIPPSIRLNVEFPSLLHPGISIRDRSWVPALVGEAMRDPDAPINMWQSCLNNGLHWKTKNEVTNEADGRLELTELICQTFRQQATSVSPQAIDWLTRTCDAILQPIGARVAIHDDASSPDADATVHTVAMDRPRRLRQFGVSVFADAKRYWIIRQEVDVPERRSRLEMKLREFARARKANPTLVAELAESLVELVFTKSLMDGQWASWYGELDGPQRDQATTLMRRLLRELLFVQKNVDPEISTTADQLLDLMADEGIHVRDSVTYPTGQGRWEIQLGGVGEVDDSPSVRGLQYEMPDESTDACTLVRISDQSALATFLDREQDRLRLIRGETTQWNGWRHHDVMLLGLSGEINDEVERLELTLPWIECLLQITESDHTLHTPLLRKHLSGLLRTLPVDRLLVPGLTPDESRYLPVKECDESSIDVSWERSSKPNGHIIRCGALSMLSDRPGDSELDSKPRVLRRGRVTLSLGPNFSDEIGRTLDLASRDDSLSQMPQASGLPEFARSIERLRWRTTEFSSLCDATGQMIGEFLRTEQGRVWFNDWIHRVIRGSASVDWYRWIRSREWFECFPELDLERTIAFWPAATSSGFRNVGVAASDQPAGRVIDVDSTVFSTRPVKAETTLSGGKVLDEACLLSTKIQSLVCANMDDHSFNPLGRPLMQCVGTLRDPLGESTSRDSITVDMFLELLDRVVSFHVAAVADSSTSDTAAQRCDDVLSILHDMARQSGWTITPRNWSFMDPDRVRDRITDDNTIRDFCDSPRGEVALNRIGLTTAKNAVIRPCQLRLSLGQPPDGYADLNAIVAATRSRVPQSERRKPVIARVENALAELRATLAIDDDAEGNGDAAFSIVELWQASWQHWLPYLTHLDSSSDEISQSAERWRTSLHRLAKSFGLNVFGEPGRPINYLRGNIDTWFDYDPEQLSEASRLTPGGIAVIKSIELPGLVRQDAMSPLLRAKVKF